MSRPLAVVTGASRGIGKQICIDFAREGWDIVAIARSTAESPTKLPGTVDETVQLAIEASGGQAKAIAVGIDVRDEEKIKELADRVYDEFGRCDLIVNNAAIAPPGHALEDSTKRWRMAVDINVNGPFYFMYYFCPRMEQGRVVNISSSASVWVEFARPSYSTTKRALEALSESIAYELKGKVAVNALRLDLSVWSEGFAFTLPDEDLSHFEDPTVMSDAVFWFARQPFDFTGKVLSLTDMRLMGAVRPPTTVGERGKKH